MGANAVPLRPRPRSHDRREEPVAPRRRREAVAESFGLGPKRVGLSLLASPRQCRVVPRRKANSQPMMLYSAGWAAT